MRTKLIWGCLILLLIAVIALGIFTFIEYRAWTTPWGTENDTFTMDIEEGKSAKQIANMLVEKGVMKNTTMFLIMADFRGIGEKLQAGEYLFKGTQSPYEILDMLATGKQYFRPLVIPEGFTQLEIAQRCEDTKICSATDFLDYCQSYDLFKFVVAEAPGGANASLEGILLPDTYYLFKNTPPIKVVERMTKNFETTIKELYDEAVKKEEEGEIKLWWKDPLLSYSQQVHQVAVLASIIEKEVKNDQDRPQVASVFVNRINKKMPLQADSTIHYALNDWSRPLTTDDTKINSPYNTYTNPGLPPAAICNPGKASLRAAIMPARTDYLYFISLNGETKFTASYDEFLTWKKEMKRNNKKQE